MKKIYLSPEMEVIEIKMTCMLAASLLLDSSETITNDGDILSPEFSEETQIDFFK